MTADDRTRFPTIQATLKDGRAATVRFLLPADGPRLGDFYEGLDENAKRFYWPHPLDREHAMANAARADSPTEVVLLLEATAGTLGGYAWYRWREVTAQASGFGICIAVNCQSCGAGRVLMERLLEVARTVGPPRMCLTVQHANARAVELYQKLGFRVTREGMLCARRQWPAEPQYWMERTVC
jgi:ribosomal protein S18 acetylase RimI-like enzyme